MRKVEDYGFVSAAILREQGFTAKELRAAGLGQNCRELLFTAKFTEQELLDAGFTPAQIQKAKIGAGATLSGEPGPMRHREWAK